MQESGEDSQNLNQKAFKISEKKAKKHAKLMYDYLNPEGKPFLEEKEILELFKVAYLGVRTEANVTIDDIMSYLNFHGSRKVYGKITFEEFEAMVVRLLTLNERERMDELNHKREEMRLYKESLQRELNGAIGKELVDEELRYGMSLFEKYDVNRNGFLEDFEIPQILIDTYAVMKVEYHPTEEDVYNYIKTMDLDEDGKISRTEYEVFLLQALHSRGIRVNRVDHLI